ncbi:serine/threonine-protein kinase 32A isoform X2 [Harmonia axyridis]|uniref:serine/threonine-protein kinase 32A isoform X2 n=1 Tax=Harmonia axyridis TaxID=115357 RepID=UPI001E276CA6|nr:serine/threonine-protein kinase 32A isoform X2 [Harmonia axyridis]
MGVNQSTRNEKIYGEEVNFDHFQILRAIGKGSFGKVCIVQKRDTKQMFAMKYMNKNQCMEKDALKNVIREVDILTRLEHPFLVNMWFSFQDEEDFFMVTDLLLGGDLRYHISHLIHFSEDGVKLMIYEMGLALDYLQSKNIIHRDIKPDNILLDGLGHFHITDFNIATILHDNRLATSMSGTKPYIAPEIFECAMEMCLGYSYAVDWWSLGISAYEMLRGLRPFDIHSTTSMQEVRVMFQNGVEYPRMWSESIVDLIGRLLCMSPGMRISNAVELRQVKCLQKYDVEALLQRLYQPPFQPPKDHLNCDPSFELEEMIIETKPLHKKKKRLAKQRSIREIQNPANQELDSESPLDSPLAYIPDFKVFNRYQEMAKKLREEKEAAWERELEHAMNLSDPISWAPPAKEMPAKKIPAKEIPAGCSSKLQESDCHAPAKTENHDSLNEAKGKPHSSSGPLLKITEKEENEVIDDQNRMQTLDFIDRTPSPSEKSTTNQ